MPFFFIRFIVFSKFLKILMQDCKKETCKDTKKIHMQRYLLNTSVQLALLFIRTITC